MIYSKAVSTLKRMLPKQFFDLLVKARQLSKRAHPDSALFIDKVRGRSGVEIGGPSSLFRFELPLYAVVGTLDGVNFSNQTLWEGSLQSGQNFSFRDGSTGRQYISDATNLSEIAGEKYDFALSSNCLEHVANPLRALAEWRRVIKRGGALVLAVPRKETNFDHRRPVTSFRHLLADFENKVGEDDLTHLDEILSLHDLSLDPEAGEFDAFRRRSADNLSNRTLHHHVFDLDLAAQVVTFSGFVVVHAISTSRDHVVLAMKPESG